MFSSSYLSVIVNSGLILIEYANTELKRLERFAAWLVRAVAAEDAPHQAAQPLLEGFSVKFVLLFRD